jgi:hypothetical protein
MSDEQIAHVRMIDRADAEIFASTSKTASNGVISQLWLWIRKLF